jgi:hypothetical protein
MSNNKNQNQNISKNESDVISSFSLPSSNASILSLNLIGK